MEENKKIHSLKYLKPYRTALRNASTSAEAVLWNYLKGKQLEGRKFRRQHSIENFIVDFYCPSEQLIIELDGQHHFDAIGKLNDSERDARLNTLGFKVLRFENKLVFQRLDEVLKFIVNNFHNPPNVDS